MSFINVNNPPVIGHRGWNILLSSETAATVLGGNFVVTGSSVPDVKYSADAITWNSVSTGFQLGAIVQVTNTTFRAFGGVSFFGEFRSCVSTDGGVSWTSQQTNAIPGLADGAIVNDVKFNGSLYVAVITNAFGGNWGVIITSADFVTWTVRQTFPLLGFISVFWTGARWLATLTSTPANVALPDGPVFTSSDGIAWTQTLVAPFPGVTQTIRGIRQIGSRVLACGNDGALSVGYTNDTSISTAWTNPAIGGSTGGSDFAYNSTGNVLVLARAFTRLMNYSTDTGTTWNACTVPAGTASVGNLVYKNGLFVNCTGVGDCYYSGDGITFTKVAAAVGTGWVFIV